MNGLSDRNILDTFCTEFCSIIEKYARYIIVSGFLVIASGRVRATEDIDMITERINKQTFVKLHTDLLQSGFVCMQSDNPEEIYDHYLTQQTSIRYTYKNKLVPQMEVKFAKDALDDYQLRTRQKIPLTGLDVWFSSIEINIAFKEEYLKSDKDLEDAKHLRKVYSEKIDEQEITRTKQLIRKLRL